ncbi:MAG: HIT domain-containing protein [Clostridiales bacterium]|nr:HIT domain-containing protein [Clostridiales bacterium]
MKKINILIAVIVFSKGDKMEDKDLIKLSVKELVDMGVCPTCLDRRTNGGVYGDCTKLELYSDSDIDCMFVQNPRAVGHMMIGAQTHYHDFTEAPDELNAKIMRFAKQFAIIIKQVYKCERVYICTMSDGPMNHYHIQLIPRYPYEERGSANFVKPRKNYVHDENSVALIRQLINEYAKK